MRLALGESETGRFRIFAEMKVYSHLLGGEGREKCNKSGNGDRPKQPQAGSQVASSLLKNWISFQIQVNNPDRSEASLIAHFSIVKVRT